MASTGSGMVMRGLFLVILLVGVASSASCPPPEEKRADPSLDEMFYYSDAVVLGEVVRRIDDGDSPEVYTAEMSVHCVYKGHHIPTAINITKAGNSSDVCFTTDFQQGLSYLAYLKQDEAGVFSPAYPQSPENYKDELYIMCDSNVTYPVGLTKDTATVKCEDDYAYEGQDYVLEEGEEGEEGEEPIPCLPPFQPPVEPPYQPAKTQEEGEDGNPNGSGTTSTSLGLLALLISVSMVVS